MRQSGGFPAGLSHIAADLPCNFTPDGSSASDNYDAVPRNPIEVYVLPLALPSDAKRQFCKDANMDLVANHVVFVAVAFGAMYFVIWAIYRLSRHLKYRKYLAVNEDERIKRAHYDTRLDELRREELLRRAEWERENGDPESYSRNQSDSTALQIRNELTRRKTFDATHGVEAHERHRRAQWDASHGPLMYPLDLREREEGRWPLGAALQQASSVIVGLLVALLIWGSRSNPQGPGAGSDAAEKSHGIDGIAILPLFAIALLISGTALTLLSSYRWARIFGSVVIVSSAAFSGWKVSIFENGKLEPKIEKIEFNPPNAKPDGDAKKSYIYSFSFPAFDVGTSEPNPILQCAIHTFAREIEHDQTLSSINIIGRADRRELRPALRQKFASNWGLAQQRGACVQETLLRVGVRPELILVTTAGPMHTSLSSSTSSLDADRAITVRLRGEGKAGEWSTKVTQQGGQWTFCDPQAVLLEDPCLSK